MGIDHSDTAPPGHDLLYVGVAKPPELPNSFLEQAFKHLDQEQLIASASLVCRQWQQLALRSLRSIQTRPTKPAGPHRLAFWLSKHGSSLASLTGVSINLARCRAGWSPRNELLAPITTLPQLASLRLTGQHGDRGLLDTRLSPQALPHLTELRLHHWVPSLFMLQSLNVLTGLQALNLVDNTDDVLGPHFLLAVASSLVQLTSLDLSYPIHPAPQVTDALSSLSALTRLQQLQLAGVGVQAGDLTKLQGLPIRAVSIHLGPVEAGLVVRWIHGCRGRLERLGLVVRGFFGGPLGQQVASSLYSALCAPAATLKDLSLEGGSLDFQPYLAHFCSMTQLTRLGLHDCGLDDGMLPQLSSALPGLRELDVSWNGGSIMGEQSSMETLAAGLPHLTRLVVGRAPELADAVRQGFGDRIMGEEEEWTTRTYVLRPQG